MRLTFQQVKKKIESMVPSDLDYEVDLEAASIAIVTSEPEAFSGTDSLASKIAKSIKRRIEIRPSEDILMATKEAEAKIIEMQNTYIPDVPLYQGNNPKSAKEYYEFTNYTKNTIYRRKIFL